MRREQNLALVGAVVTGAVIATGLLLVLVARVNPAAGERLRAAIVDITAPVWSVVRLPIDGAGRAIDWAGDYLGAVSRNRQLQADLARARAELERAALERRELAQMKRLLAARDPNRGLVVTARIVAATPGSAVRSAMIAAGGADGLVPNMPVRTADGLIGRTIEVGDHVSRVLLLSDPQSRVPITIVRTGQAALAAGLNGPIVEVRDRVGADTPLAAGDRLVTSGDGGIFPPGVPVAIVVDARSDPPRARPVASPLGAGYVLVEPAYLPLPAAATEAASPAPVPIEARKSGARAPAKPAPIAPR